MSFSICTEECMKSNYCQGETACARCGETSAACEMVWDERNECYFCDSCAAALDEEERESEEEDGE